MAVSSQISQSNSSVPELHLVLAWVGSVIAFASWFHFALQTPVIDILTITATHLVVLPIISRKLNLVLLPALGCLILGVGTGFQLIDLCFDILIICNRSVHDGQAVTEGRKVAWFYYNTMLNARHVNVAIALFLLVGQFGALVGLTRSPPKIRRIWITLVCVMVLGNGGYLLAVVPRYLAIRASVAFDNTFFDGWWAVLAARTWLFLCLGVAMFACCFLLVVTHAEQNNSKKHLE